MPLYRYVVKTKDGRRVREVGDAETKEVLLRKLRADGVFIISVEELGRDKPQAATLKELFIARRFGKYKAIKFLDMCFFARNLSITLSAGVSLLRSLEVIAVQTESLGLAAVIKKVSEDIKGGLSLSEAMQKHPRVFSPLWRGIVEVGEASGNLPFVLEKLADYLEARFEFERRVKSALIYPIMVTIFATIAIFIFFKIVLPKFTTIFDQFDIRLPFITQLLFDISTIVNKNFIWIVFLSIGFLVGFWQFKTRKFGKEVLDKINLFLPLVGRLTLISALERFSSTMYILLESGVSIIYALDVLSQSIGNAVIARKVAFMRENVRGGKSLSGELARIEVFPPLICEVAKIGEEAGNMPEMFEKLSLHYQKELATRLERLTAMFEPLMIFFLGITIGTIVVALFLPIFKLVTIGGTGGG